MADKDKTLLKNLSVLTLSVGLTQIIALILKTMMPRIFGPEKMGIFYFAESRAMLFFAFLPLGLTTYLNRHLAGRPEHVKEILWTVLAVQTGMAILIASALYGSLVWQGHDQETIIVSMLMGGYAALFTFQKEIFQKIYILLGEVVMISRLNVLVKIVLVSGSLVIFYTMPSIALIAAMHLASEFFGFLYLLRVAWKSHYVNVRMGTPHFKAMLAFSLPFYFASVLNGVYAQIDFFMLGELSTPIEIGYFGAAYKIIGIGLFLVPVFQNAVTPVLAEALAESEASFTHFVKKYLHNLMICALPLAVGLILFGNDVAGLINGPEFDVSKRTLAYLTPVLLMMYLNTFLGGCLYLASSGPRLSIIFIFGGLINIALDHFLIPWGSRTFGIGGAGVAVSFATFLCEAFVFSAMLFMLPQRILSGRLLWNALVVFLPCWLGMYFHQTISDTAFWIRCLVLPLALPYAFATGLVGLGDVQALKRLLPRKSL